MPHYLDSKGNIIEHSELEHSLLEKSPELFDVYSGLNEFRKMLWHYGKFLYLIYLDEEVSLKSSERKKWEELILYIDSQQELRSYLDKLEDLLGNKNLNPGDRVLVARSDRPFVDTLFEENRIGDCCGWIGNLEEYALTNTHSSKYFSEDNLIRRRIVLSNAIKISDDDLKGWVSGNIEKLYSRRDHTITHYINKLSNHKLGAERILIYDKYPNIDIYKFSLPS